MSQHVGYRYLFCSSNNGLGLDRNIQLVCLNSQRFSLIFDGVTCFLVFTQTVKHLNLSVIQFKQYKSKYKLNNLTGQYLSPVLLVSFQLV